MSFELERENINLKVDLMQNMVCRTVPGSYEIDGKPLKSVTGKVFSFTIKEWNDGGVTATLGIQDEELNMWLGFNDKSYFAIQLYNQLLNNSYNKFVTFEFWTSWNDDKSRKFLNCSVKSKGQKVGKKYPERSLLPSVETLIEDMLMKYGKAGEPKADDEIEPDYEDVPKAVSIHSNILPQENPENTATDDENVPF